MIKESIILALDQATLTGYSVFKGNKLISYGVLNLKDIDKKHNGDVYFDEKVENIKQFMIRCIDFFKPDIVIIEDIQQQMNVQTFKNLAYLQGTLKNYLFGIGKPYSVLKPSEWRKELGIKGRERKIVKANTQKYVKETYGLDVSEDEADSMCIGTAGNKLLKKGKLIIYKDI